tara:strand:+ start:1151 stop:1936 length:786 start_codon:yes stop_codon:yes gene_type:complete
MADIPNAQSPNITKAQLDLKAIQTLNNSKDDILDVNGKQDFKQAFDFEANQSKSSQRFKEIEAGYFKMTGDYDDFSDSNVKSSETDSASMRDVIKDEPAKQLHLNDELAMRYQHVFFGWFSQFNVTNKVLPHKSIQQFIENFIQSHEKFTTVEGLKGHHFRFKQHISMEVQMVQRQEVLNIKLLVNRSLHDDLIKQIYALADFLKSKLNLETDPVIELEQVDYLEQFNNESDERSGSQDEESSDQQHLAESDKDASLGGFF